MTDNEDDLTEKNDEITIYTDEDYRGDLNLKVLEKATIIQAALKYQRYRRLMAKAIGMSNRNLFRRIMAHSLDELFEHNNKDEALRTELKRLVTEWPLIFESREKFLKREFELKYT